MHRQGVEIPLLENLGFKTAGNERRLARQGRRTPSQSRPRPRKSAPGRGTCPQSRKRRNPERAEELAEPRATSRFNGGDTWQIQTSPPLTSTRRNAVQRAVHLRQGRGGHRRPAARREARNRLCRALQCRQVEPDQCADRPHEPRAGLGHARAHARAQFLHPRQGRGALSGRHAGLRLCEGLARRRSKAGPG